MNQLNKLPFKCQYTPKCEKEILYEGYVAHFKECPEGKPKQCENPDCQQMVSMLVNQITQFKEELSQLELYKERNAVIMKNQISDLKAQVKGGAAQQEGVDQVGQLKTKILELE